MTLAEIMAYGLDIAGVSDEAAAQTAARRFALQRYRSLWEARAWREVCTLTTLTTITGQAVYTLELAQVIAARTNEAELTRLDPEVLLREYPAQLSASGTPEHWRQVSRAGGKITVQLYPAPDAALTVYWYGQQCFPDAVADGDTVQLPGSETALCALVTADLLGWRHLTARRQSYLEEGMAYLQTMNGLEDRSVT